VQLYHFGGNSASGGNPQDLSFRRQGTHGVSFDMINAGFARIHATLPGNFSGSCLPHNVAKHQSRSEQRLKTPFSPGGSHQRPFYLAENDAAPEAASCNSHVRLGQHMRQNWHTALSAKRAKQMSYNDTGTLCGRNFSQNRLDALLRPIVGINHGRKRPLILTNDKFCGSFSSRKSVFSDCLL
jgi:hypothetical protein